MFNLMVEEGLNLKFDKSTRTKWKKIEGEYMHLYKYIANFFMHIFLL
jgi:hypothetical protein